MSQPIFLNRCTRFILDLIFLTLLYTTHHEWVKVARNTVVMKKESGKTGRKTRRRKPIDGESKRIIRELILDILKDFPEEFPGFSLQSSENPLPLLCKSIKKKQ